MDKSDNPKSRGWQHRTNKKKYSKNKTAAHVPPPKPRTALESNWDRYEQEPEEIKVSSSTDFSVLAQAPITHGSHFQFKSDKDYALDIEPVNTSSFFNLDLSLLEKSLATISFCVRSGIEQDYFTESQHKIMNVLDDKVRDYDNYLKSYQTRQPDVIFGSEGGMSEDESDAHEVDTSAKGELSQDIGPVETLPKSDKVQEEDLEEWLDDILDD